MGEEVGENHLIDKMSKRWVLRRNVRDDRLEI